MQVASGISCCFVAMLKLFVSGDIYICILKAIV